MARRKRSDMARGSRGLRPEPMAGSITRRQQTTVSTANSAVKARRVCTSGGTVVPARRREWMRIWSASSMLELGSGLELGLGQGRAREVQLLKPEKHFLGEDIFPRISKI